MRRVYCFNSHLNCCSHACADLAELWSPERQNGELGATLKAWLLTKLPESARCCWAVLIHLLASVHKLASHPSPDMHHAASCCSCVVAPRAPATDHVRALRFSGAQALQCSSISVFATAFPLATLPALYVWLSLLAPLPLPASGRGVVAAMVDTWGSVQALKVPDQCPKRAS